MDMEHLAEARMYSEDLCMFSPPECLDCCDFSGLDHFSGKQNMLDLNWKCTQELSLSVVSDRTRGKQQGAHP